MTEYDSVRFILQPNNTKRKVDDSPYCFLVIMRINVTSHSPEYQVYRILGILLALNTTVVWFGTLLTLFGQWGAAENFDRPDTVDGDLIYISSEIAIHLPGMILCAITAGFPYFLTLFFTKIYYDIYLNRYKRIISFLSVVFGFLTVISLFVLTVVDSIRFKAVHYTFVGIFIYSNLITGILTIIYRYRRDQSNKVIIVRGLIIAFCIPLTIIFIVLASIGMSKNRSDVNSAAGFFEWFIAIVLIFYYGTFTFDLLLYKI